MLGIMDEVCVWFAIHNNNLIRKTMQKSRGFADNGACPVGPTGGGTCRKEGQAPLITESALSLLGESLEGEGGCFFLSPRWG